MASMIPLVLCRKGGYNRNVNQKTADRHLYCIEQATTDSSTRCGTGVEQTKFQFACDNDYM